MTKKTGLVLTAVCGIMGTIALTIYFSATFTFMPLPPPTASAADIIIFGNKYHTILLADTWLQQFGTILSVIFALALVHLAGASQTFAGRLTLLTCTVIVSLSLAEGTFVLGAMQSGQNGHPEAALTCFELTNVFIHIFLLAPSLFLLLGIAIRQTDILPKLFSASAIILGVLFQTLGVVALFNEKFLLLVIAVLMIQNVWTIAAAVTLLVRKNSISLNR